MIELRPYQAQDVERLRAAYAGGRRAVCYVLPTGGGKTIVFVHVVDGAVSKAPAPGWRCEACGCLNDLAAEQCGACQARRPTPGCRQPWRRSTRCGELSPTVFARIAKMPHRRFVVARPRSEPELRAYAKAHGYKPGWVWHRLREQERSEA